MTTAEAIQHIQSQTGGQRHWRYERQGWIDWKFGELAEHLGYQRAREYIEAARRWADGKAIGSVLDVTFAAFEKAQN